GTSDPGEGYLARHRGAARRARGTQGAHGRWGGGSAARPPQGGRRRADRLAVLYPAGSEGRQGAAHRARSHPRHPKELGLPAEPQDGGPELGSRYRPQNRGTLRCDAPRPPIPPSLIGVAFLMRKRPPAASVLDFPVLSPCLFSSLLDCQSKNVCGHRETRRTSLARQSFHLPRNALCLRSRVLPPKFYFTCHDTYSRNKYSTYSNSHQTSNQSNAYRASQAAPHEGGR